MRKKHRIVVKVGTSTLTNELGNSNLRTMERLVMTLADIQNRGNEVILVSSGAIAVGANKMHLSEKPKEMRMKQAAAAVGQCENMFLYDKFFSYYDTVSYTEIESEEKLFGDNDMLSAVVAVLCNADRLIILSDIDGFYDKDPRLYKDAKLISRIETIDEETYKLAGGAGSRRGTGGMRTKLQAADIATRQGVSVIVTNGKNPDVLYDIADGKKVGTLFVGAKS